MVNDDRVEVHSMEAPGNARTQFAQNDFVSMKRNGPAAMINSKFSDLDR